MAEPPPPTSIPTSGPMPVAMGPDLSPVDAPAPQEPNVGPEPIEGEDTVSLRIDGHEVTVRKGTNVLEAATMRGEDISHFCYHRGLSVAASCRQCLVEIEGMGKLQPSCQIEVRDDMVVHTKTDAVQKARRDMLEFTLKNHPIDCPICDKAGECTLQRHYMDHDHALTRVDVEKIRKPKHKDIGREIILDAERCILCSRCIRFCDEVPGTGELTMINRGDREILDIAQGHRLDNAYSINVVDLCPVGALTAKDFRFQIRAWELGSTDTTCPGCATGCAVELHTKHEQAYRLVPRHDPDVNGHWMCDEGRHTYEELDPKTRTRHARVDGETLPLDEALQTTARRLQGKSTAVVFSSTATNEANRAMAALADALGAERFVLGRPPGKADTLLRDADKNPNTRGAHAEAGDGVRHEAELSLQLAGRAYEAVVFLDDEGEVSEVVRASLSSLTSVVLSDRRNALSEACTIALPAASWGELLGTYTNRQGALRVVRPAWRPENDRRHRADLVRALLLALGGKDIGTARDLTRAVATEHDHQALLAMLAEPVTARPRLMRFGNSRG
ncbi:MAG: 2Fe-2S iron-sulfur cluster-binding protein [Myxococcota bacterium]